MQSQLIYSPEVWEGVLGKEKCAPVAQFSCGLDVDNVGIRLESLADDDEIAFGRFFALAVDAPRFSAALEAPADVDDLERVAFGGGSKVDFGADDQVGVEEFDQAAQELRSPLLRVGAMLADVADETERVADVAEPQAARVSRVWFHAAELYRIIDAAERESAGQGVQETPPPVRG